MPPCWTPDYQDHVDPGNQVVVDPGNQVVVDLGNQVVQQPAPSKQQWEIEGQNCT